MRGRGPRTDRLPAVHAPSRGLLDTLGHVPRLARAHPLLYDQGTMRYAYYRTTKPARRGGQRAFLIAYDDGGHIVAAGRIADRERDPVTPQWYECYRGDSESLPDSIPLAEVEFIDIGAR